MDLELAAEQDGERSVLRVRGELDVYTSPRLRQAIVDLVTAGQTDITVEMSELAFIDSTGLGVLVGALRRVREVSGELRLVGVRPNVFRAFEITGLTKVFSISEPSDP